MRSGLLQANFGLAHAGLAHGLASGSFCMGWLWLTSGWLWTNVEPTLGGWLGRAWANFGTLLGRLETDLGLNFG